MSAPIMTALKRQDGSVSRTKTLNAAGLILAIIGAVLPAFEVFVPQEVYSAVMAIWAVVNQHLRDSQTRI